MSEPATTSTVCLGCVHSPLEHDRRGCLKCGCEHPYGNVNYRPPCPECGKALQPVRYTGGYLNPDQFDSIRAGDWFCDSCKGTRSGSGYRYFWDKELQALELPAHCDVLIQDRAQQPPTPAAEAPKPPTPNKDKIRALVDQVLAESYFGPGESQRLWMAGAILRGLGAMLRPPYDRQLRALADSLDSTAEAELEEEWPK